MALRKLLQTARTVYFEVSNGARAIKLQFRNFIYNNKYLPKVFVQISRRYLCGIHNRRVKNLNVAVTKLRGVSKSVETN